MVKQLYLYSLAQGNLSQAMALFRFRLWIRSTAVNASTDRKLYSMCRTSTQVVSVVSPTF